MHSLVNEGRENALSVVIEMGLKGKSEIAKHWMGKSENNFETMIKKGPS